MWAVARRYSARPVREIPPQDGSKGIVRKFLEPKTFNLSMCLPLHCDHIPERCS